MPTRSQPGVLPLAITLHLVAVAIWTRGLTALYDLEVYRAGGARILHGGPLYDGYVFWVLDFTYPPFAAVLFTPLALIPSGLLKIIFTTINLAALVAVVWLCLRALDRERRPAVVITLTGLLFLLEPVRSTIDIGQVNLLLMLVVLADLVRPGTRYQGVGVGIAAGIKLVPGVFVLYLLLTRRWRAAGTAVAAFVTTVGLGFAVAPTDSVKYWTGTFLTTNRIGVLDEAGNQSLSGLLARVGQTSMLVWLPVALVVGVAGMALAVRVQRRGNELLGVTLCGLTACLCAPFAWNHHWVWFVPLLVIVGYRARWVAVALYLLLLDWPVSLPHRDWIFPPPTGLIQLAIPGWLTRNLYVLVALGVFAVVWRSGAAGRAPAAGDLGEHDPGGDGGVERLDAGGHGDRDGLVTGLADQPGQAAPLGADHHDER
jgi:alpha-1,2-mannosyltransferase